MGAGALTDKKNPAQALLPPRAQQRWASGREGELRREESRPSGKLGEAARSECLGVGERQDAICKLGPFYVASWVVGTSILRRGDAGSLLGYQLGRVPLRSPLQAQGRWKGLPGTEDGRPPRHGSYTACEHSDFRPVWNLEAQIDTSKLPPLTWNPPFPLQHHHQLPLRTERRDNPCNRRERKTPAHF